MELSRRETLGVVASGMLSGCAGVGVPSVPSVPNPFGGGGRTNAEPGGATGDTTPAAGASATRTRTATPTPSETGASTRRVFDELAWFATEYGPATAAVRSLAARMRNLADALSRRSSITGEDVATLQRLTDRIETTIRERLGPHFQTSPPVVSFTRARIDRIETLRAREDWDGVAAVLSDLGERYATVASESYVARTFPRDPVRGPLVDYVTRSGHADDAAVMAYHAGADATVRIQRDPEAYPGPLPGGRSDVERYRTLFGPMAAGAGGDAGAYLTVTNLIDGRTLPLSVRRYRDADAARTAVEAALSGGVTEERTAEFGGREWRRIFYRPAQDVVYADLARTGAYLITVGPSGRPWDDRSADWLTPLRLTWLWEGGE